MAYQLIQMEKLFGTFPATDAAAWKARLEKDLKGITFDQLSLTDRNGIRIAPFYTAEDLPPSSAPAITHKDWYICASIAAEDAAAANKQALDELNQGASGLHFVVGPATDPATLLRDIELPYIYSRFSLSPATLPFAGALKDFLQEKGWQQDQMACFVSCDPIPAYLRGEAGGPDLALPPENAICADASLFQNAGATPVYELACALALLTEYLYRAEAGGQLSRVCRLHLTLATDTGFFEQIAKLRAVRRLVILLEAQYGIDIPLHLHVETSNIYRAPFDSYNNLLRDTIAGMAAVLGGCNSLYIRPFDETLQPGHPFSRRMSRNQQLIFKEESYLDKVADAAAGSYYLEHLTETIAAKAWEAFKTIEAGGGLIAAYDNGTLCDTITQQAQQLVREYKEGKRVLVGVNKFPNPEDEPKPLPPELPGGKGLKPLNLARELV